jgi:hypothetical protein
MARFVQPRNPVFVDSSPDDDDETAEGLPAPITTKARARRAAAISEAKSIIEHLPSEGETAHILFSRRLELTDVFNAVLDTMGKCQRMTIATLGFSKRSLRSMCEWIDAGKVQSLHLLASRFWQAHNASGLWPETQEEFKARGQRVAIAPSHAKICVMRFANNANLCSEGSSNLCSSGSGIEAIALTHDANLCDWHERWIHERLSRVA